MFNDLELTCFLWMEEMSVTIRSFLLKSTYLEKLKFYHTDILSNVLTNYMDKENEKINKLNKQTNKEANNLNTILKLKY